MKSAHPIHPDRATTSGQEPRKGESEGGRRPTGASPFLDATDKHLEASPPATEIMETIPRRTFSAHYKLRILQEADACGHGQLGAMLRREGLYYSHIKDWREQRDSGALEALSRKRGRKKAAKNPLAAENARLEKQNRQLEEELRKARIIIEYQKKWRSCWGSRVKGRTHDADTFAVRRNREHQRGLCGNGSFQGHVSQAPETKSSESFPSISAPGIEGQRTTSGFGCVAF